MKINPLISIIMPVYNAALFIDACIESIIKQTYENWELLIVDDFSTDKSTQHIEKWVNNDHRIHLYKNKTKGIIPALQLAFDESTGAYITRMDADDLMPPNKLEYFVKEIIIGKKQLITGKVTYFSSHPVSEGYIRYENWLNALIEKQNHWEYIFRECVIASPNWLVHRDCFISDFSFSDLSYPEDYDMVFKWYKKEYQITSINKVTHLWREHPKRTSRTVEAYQQKAFFKLKTKHFIEINCDKKDIIQVIGAGDKGKMVIQTLIENNIQFEWFDIDAAKKQTNLKSEIQPISKISNKYKTILTVWPTDLKIQKKISTFLSEKELKNGLNYWLF